MGVRKVEFPGLSLTTLSQDNLRELKNLMDVTGVACVSLNAVTDLVPVNLGNLVSPQKKERTTALTHVKRLIEIAPLLGSDTVICDTGTTTEDVAVGSEAVTGEENALVDSCLELLALAEPAALSFVLQPVPGRRWVPCDAYPPDSSPVVERHVWPWRRWLQDKEIVDNLERKLARSRVAWAFDVANAVPAAGCSPLDVAATISYFLERNLKRVYLANHPGPYNRTWHRLLRHQDLCDGFFTPADFHALLKQLEHNDYDGEVVLLIAEKNPSTEKLRRSLGTVQPGNQEGSPHPVPPSPPIPR